MTVTVTVTVTVAVTDDDRRLVLHGGSVQQVEQSWSSFGSCTCGEWDKSFNYVI